MAIVRSLRPSRQIVVVGCVLLLGAAGIGLLASRSRQRVVEAGFWFECIDYESAALGGSLTPQDHARIASLAWAEVLHAFAGLRIGFSDRRDATYRVAVVPRLRNPRFKSSIGVAGASWTLRGVGGQGAVSFDFLASGAAAYAPPDADRDAIVAAIGRGIARSAVHEFAHQMLPGAPIHSTDAKSYEYGSASRAEQYYGDLRWDTARLRLEERFGMREGVPAAGPPGPPPALPACTP